MHRTAHKTRLKKIFQSLEVTILLKKVDKKSAEWKEPSNGSRRARDESLTKAGGNNPVPP